MKKLLTMMLALVMSLSISLVNTEQSFATENTVHLEGAVVVDGRTLVPLRSIFESLGAEVKWNNDTQTITASKDDTVIILQINSKTAKINDQIQPLDVPAQLIHSKTMVPVRFVSEALGAEVNWNGAESVVEIYKNQIQIRVAVTANKPPSTPVIQISDDELNRIKNFQSKRHARAAHKDGWIYYYKTWGASVNEYGLYKEKLNGTPLGGKGSVLLTKDEIYNLTVVGDWVYYTTFDDLTYGTKKDPYELFKISLDGKKKQKLMTLGHSSEVVFINEHWIYYIPENETDFSDSDWTKHTAKLYKLSTDGKQKKYVGQFSAYLGNIQVIGDTIYVSGSDGFNVIKEDGTGHINYPNINPSHHGFILKDNWIYYSDFGDLRKAKLDGTQIVQLIPGNFKLEKDGSLTYVDTPLYSQEMWNFNIKGDSIYFTKNKNLHKYDLKTGNITQLNNETTHVQLVGDYVFSSVDTYKVQAKLFKIK